MNIGSLGDGDKSFFDKNSIIIASGQNGIMIVFVLYHVFPLQKYPN